MKWLFLVHQVLTPNSRERVKVWRSIKKTGAILYRNSVYVLPYSKERLEDFQWVCQEIRDSSGEASVFVSNGQDAKEDRLLRSQFQTARKEDYADLTKAALGLLARLGSARLNRTRGKALFRKLARDAEQLRASVANVRAIDYFANGPPKELVRYLKTISRQVASSNLESQAPTTLQSVQRKDFQKKVWATRDHIHIDRLCSAWFIRRFVDPAAQFVFAPESRLPKDAISFDVLGADFSHHGDRCTFETFLKRFRIQDRGLEKIAELVHDVDLKDHKFGRPEAPGIDAVLNALSAHVNDDRKLLEIGSILLDALYRLYTNTGK